MLTDSLHAADAAESQASGLGSKKAAGPAPMRTSAATQGGTALDPATDPNLAAQLERLNNLRAEGFLSDSSYEAARLDTLSGGGIPIAL